MSSTIYSPVTISVLGKSYTVQFFPNRIRNLTTLKAAWSRHDGGTVNMVPGEEKGDGAKERMIQKAITSIQNWMVSQKSVAPDAIVSICGPSCGGKSHLADTLLSRFPELFHRCITVTTRPSRNGEINGVHYQFVTDMDFDGFVATGNMIEYVSQSGFRYGLPASSIAAALEHNLVGICIQTPDGVKALEAYCNKHNIMLYKVFVTAPIETLIVRLLQRFRRDAESTAHIHAVRMINILNEASFWQFACEFDLKIDNFDDAAIESTHNAIFGWVRMTGMTQWIYRDSVVGSESD